MYALIKTIIIYIHRIYSFISKEFFPNIKVYFNEKRIRNKNKVLLFQNNVVKGKYTCIFMLDNK